MTTGLLTLEWKRNSQNTKYIWCSSVEAGGAELATPATSDPVSIWTVSPVQTPDLKCNVTDLFSFFQL